MEWRDFFAGRGEPFSMYDITTRGEHKGMDRVEKGAFAVERSLYRNVLLCLLSGVITAVPPFSGTSTYHVHDEKKSESSRIRTMRVRVRVLCFCFLPIYRKTLCFSPGGRIYIFSENTRGGSCPRRGTFFFYVLPRGEIYPGGKPFFIIFIISGT